MPDIPALRVSELHGFGDEAGGGWLVIEASDQSGKRFTLRIPHEKEAEFFSLFQAAAIRCAKIRGDTAQAKIVNALNPVKIDIGVTESGKIGLRMKLTIGTTLDLVLPDSAIGQFRSALDELAAYRAAGGSDRTQ